ncbi:hypothetical protein SDC9_152225 [bioreactor metagenome]|uniref:Uncharacterized protein n=1 Tax=bioreactor metagenome TaxID=1076179 RepID=A0A645EU77_9ZZZZ
MDQDILLLDKGHFHIDLGKLGLAVGAQVLVTKTLRNLVILVDPPHHQKLLEDLGRLGQSVKGARMDPARHQIVPRPLGGAFGQDRGFHLDKSVVIESFADDLDHLMAEFQIGEHRGPADVQKAVFEPQILPHARIVLNDKGQRLRLRQHLQAFRHEFHGAGFDPRVVGFLVAMPD